MIVKQVKGVYSHDLYPYLVNCTNWWHDEFLNGVMHPMSEWCNNTIGPIGLKWISNMDGFRFTNEEDAILFCLRWGNNINT